MIPQSQQLVMVSNRLPITFSKNSQNEIEVKPGSGGLVAALAPLLRNRKGLWIGWSGSSDLTEQEVEEHTTEIEKTIGFRVTSVHLTHEDINLYYNGFSNEILWPLFHDLQSECNFDPNYWYGYQTVNQKFAHRIMNSVQKEDFLWIHDYHLLLTAQELRKLGFSSEIGFFLHIPFPPLDIFLKLPWRFQILKALLSCNLIGFQTRRDHRNFIDCIEKLLPQATVESDGRITTINHFTKVAPFPISIDFQEMSKLAEKREIAEGAWYYHEKLPNQKIIFSLDRLDMTKGIPYRLRAIRHLLKTHPEVHRNVSFVQVVLPSRVEVPRYQELKAEIDRLVGEINSQFTLDAWIPIKYLFRSLNRRELLSFYRCSEVALITSIKDGMNLVAKEYIAANIEERGVLVLSEFAGAASQLSEEALLINPYDIEGLAESLYQALQMTEKERKSRMQAMRQKVKSQDVFWWVHSFLSVAANKDLSDFPVIYEYLPSEDEEVEHSPVAL